MVSVQVHFRIFPEDPDMGEWSGGHKSCRDYSCNLRGKPEGGAAFNRGGWYLTELKIPCFKRICVLQSR